MLVGAVVVYVGVQALRPAPQPVVTRALPLTIKIPGAAPALPWPSVGQSVVDVPGVGSLGPTGASGPVPIASLTKLMVAYVVLRDHPLAVGTDGPTVTISASDVARYQADKNAGDSVVAITTGETLTERQLLEALLVGSDDNIAVVLADWDTGSEPSFIAKMNSTASTIGLRNTHYDDTSGLDPASVSTASDQLRLAELDMANPVFAAIVAEPKVTLPAAGTVLNYNSLIGQDGIIGIKTGNTNAAGGCFVFAGQATVAGVTETIYGVVLGQRGSSLLHAGLNAGKALYDAARASLGSVTVLPAGTTGANVVVPWSSPVAATSSQAVTFIGWPQAVVRVGFTSARPAGAVPAGTVVGHLVLTLGDQRGDVALHASAPVHGAPLGWRLHQL